MKHAIIVLALALASPAMAQELPARDCPPTPAGPMVGEAWAIDGGTLTFVAPSGQRTMVRLWAIATPPLRVAAQGVDNVPGVRARANLDDNLVAAGRQAGCSPIAWDRQCRLIAICEAAGNDLGLRMVADGFGQVLSWTALGPTNAERGRQYAGAEVTARASRVGLWRDWLGATAP